MNRYRNAGVTPSTVATRRPAGNTRTGHGLARRNASDDMFVVFVRDQLSPLGHITARAMFGGYGLYRGVAFFGIVYANRLYFKTGPDSVDEYRRRGMQPFRPNARQTLKSYYEVPADVLEDAEMLERWARVALSAAPKKRA